MEFALKSRPTEFVPVVKKMVGRCVDFVPKDRPTKCVASVLPVMWKCATSVGISTKVMMKKMRNSTRGTAPSTSMERLMFKDVISELVTLNSY